jgi:hypothetical protein
MAPSYLLQYPDGIYFLLAFFFSTMHKYRKRPVAILLASRENELTIGEGAWSTNKCPSP